VRIYLLGNAGNGDHYVYSAHATAKSALKEKKKQLKKRGYAKGYDPLYIRTMEVEP
jgi:hypothetical protein